MALPCRLSIYFTKGLPPPQHHLRAAQKHLEELVRFEPKFQEAVALWKTRASALKM